MIKGLLKLSRKMPPCNFHTSFCCFNPCLCSFLFRVYNWYFKVYTLLFKSHFLLLTVFGCLNNIRGRRVRRWRVRGERVRGGRVQGGRVREDLNTHGTNLKTKNFRYIEDSNLQLLEVLREKLLLENNKDVIPTMIVR